jgi:hypothetical protein
MRMADLCHGVRQRYIRVQIRDQNIDGGSPITLGEMDLKVDELLQYVGRDLPILHPEKVKDRGYKNSGTWKIEKADILYNTTPGITAKTKSRLFASKTDCLIRFNISGKELPKVDLLGLSDPFLEFYTYIVGSKSWVKTWSTPVIEHTLEPKWDGLIVSVDQLCGGEYNRPLLVKCYDWNVSGSFEFIGQFETTLRSILIKQAKKHFKFKLINEALQKVSTHAHSLTHSSLNHSLTYRHITGG